MALTLGEEPITTFRQALERVSALAHAKLPAELHGHLERAHALSSDGQTWYRVNGACTCMDAPRAPQGLCKHTIAVMLYKRASEVLTSSCRRPQAAAAETTALPEAPASVNVRLCIGGADVQWTLRDQDEHRLAERLEALLTQFPQAAKATKGSGDAPAAPASGETPKCLYHGPMKASTKASGTFFCTKKLADGSYCPSRHPER